MSKESKRKGGFERAMVARERLLTIFNNTENKDYYLKDIEYAKKFDVTRHTIASIRKQFNVPPRTERILNKLKKIKTNDMTLKEISDTLNVKYQNLYKIVKEHGIEVKPDVKPIEYLKQHAKNRRLKTLELINRSGILSDIEKQLEDIDIIQSPGKRKAEK